LPGGKLTGSSDQLTKDEQAFIEKHLAAGHDVAILPTGQVRSPDFRIGVGPPFELKTLSGVKDISGVKPLGRDLEPHHQRSRSVGSHRC
jgi:hypothetical protein